MENTVGRVITLVGSSPESWEKATAVAVAAANKIAHGIHVSDVRKFYVHTENGKITSYRVRIRVAFELDEKYKPI